MSSPAVDNRLIQAYFAMRTEEAFVLNPSESRGVRPLAVFGTYVGVKLAGADTHGRYAIMENITAPHGGPPLHMHSREDEFFYVLEGEYLFEIDDRHTDAGPGSCVFAPRGTAHTFENTGATPGRMLVIVQPAGLDVFFADLDSATNGMAEPDLSIVVPIFEKHGMQLLGPPLAARERLVRAPSKPNGTS